MPIGKEVRWIIVKKRRLDGDSFASIREAVSAGSDPGPSDSKILSVLNRFDQTARWHRGRVRGLGLRQTKYSVSTRRIWR